MLNAVIAVVISYLLGSVSFSIVIARLVKGIDIRQHGSGNAGATNTLRVLGKGPGITVFILDILKGVAAVAIGYALNNEYESWTPVLCGLAAIVGHNWPIWFRFKGGKGIATTVGAIMTLAFVPALIAGLVAIAIIAITRYVSVGSLLFAALVPVGVIMMTGTGPLLWASLLICVFAFVRHRSNLVKLVKGKENKLGAKKG
ncbi:glycerol-3-phosphate 1-O-acyltransferase PlsY [Paenibacillus sp. MMS18-CY102]|uniref:glycerol-3-phosphate 1-O-acyltransferase PlsY n=1 Tax=Paenibacillus sp. MMS18-CY102 TaxID=2682849 RepID=UPI00136591CC|nr:glycerol-3-phosphate 1-O-acyltransferase PlsY [Paenibacillus sp. MMS18-CY102]MWC28449.1 glycerol-3-phosphate 1-O-acyltransferase PlsY [Paenibacillus sp. MMS18-CY102]